MPMESRSFWVGFGMLAGGGLGVSGSGGGGSEISGSVKSVSRFVLRASHNIRETPASLSGEGTYHPRV